ncbi:hypothetical protein CAI21_20210 [Alkalilimnicola ehrlichii]|uniref:Protoporphyrinogen IX oxidase n=1 Tax=Alkalilimnicola ehrlichii TaxID=351052 RepID=A0A3E0WGN7_9GAMM|nr:CopD family protein [Alkalilimnicola ehrlichii]RFA24795.1 hypothetical protein CAI21_20210 [Alkalilimnicola ehrlichii]RFA32054.1 hypothetical protein CAL65_20670 [Alkalilimnicola ehrlichii]
MPWMVFLHSLFMSVWFGCLVALPRLFSEHTACTDPEQRAWCLMMERKLFKLAMTPAAVLTVLSGFWLLFSFGFDGGWLPVKLALVSGLAFVHLYQGKVLADLRDGKYQGQRRRFLWHSLVPALVAVAIIFLVVGKPF